MELFNCETVHAYHISVLLSRVICVYESITFNKEVNTSDTFMKMIIISVEVSRMFKNLLVICHFNGF